MIENNWQTKWSQEQIRAILIEQNQSFWKQDSGVEREKLSEIKTQFDLPHAIIISGLRRVGKSTLLRQIANYLGESQLYYINFEDERFIGFQAENANQLYQTLIELFGDRKHLVIDEVQNISGWEHFVRRFMDMGKKFYITGSNASLLSRELGTKLTGRYLPIELFPFSFIEFLKYKDYTIPNKKRMTTVDQAQIQKLFDDYQRFGGLPESLKYPELKLLRILYDDVLYRDIATKYQIENIRALKELAYYLISNPTNQISYNKLKGQFFLGSVNTVKNYVEYMENSWLIFPVNVYDYSIKRQQIAAKKIYTIDNGLTNEVGFSFSPNTGRLLENLVYLALRRKTSEIYYYSTPAGHEVDFYLPEENRLIQVAQNIENPVTRERERRSLLDAMRFLGIDSSLILTNARQNSVPDNESSIKIQSAAEWLLEQG